MNPNYARKNPEWFEEVKEKSKSVWDLEYGDMCFKLLETGTVIREQFRDQNMQRDQGNVFLILKEAERERDVRKAKAAILKHHHEHSGFVPNWDDISQTKWQVKYIRYYNNLDYFSESWYQMYGFVSFASANEAKKSIEDCRSHWLTVFGAKEIK